MLDTSAFLAYLRDEPGAEIALIDGCYISIINWVEDKGQSSEVEQVEVSLLN